MTSVMERIESEGAKRILALDGGGIKGVLTLKILEKIEKVVGDKHGSARLCDHYDLIGGTSTGAIIAGALAIGSPVKDILHMYRQLGHNVFDKKWYRKGIFAPKFPAKPLRKALANFFQGKTLGDSSVQTGLGIVAKRLDTGSVWIVHNSPNAKYWNTNAQWPLEQLIRSSTAAPHYFAPEEVLVNKGKDEWGLFVDGGVSPHNNPSLQLLMLATLDGHGFNWSNRDLSLLSIGTGFVEFEMDYERRTGMKKFWHAITHPRKSLLNTAAPQAVASLGSLMHDNACLVELMMQWLSDSNMSTYRTIDSEIGDLAGDRFRGSASPSLDYQRYNAIFDDRWLHDELQITVSAKELKLLKQMDKPQSMKLLETIGAAVADKLVDPANL